MSRPGAPPAGKVEVLQRQADRIDQPMTGTAGRIRAVHFHPFANRQRLPDTAFVSSSSALTVEAVAVAFQAAQT